MKMGNNLKRVSVILSSLIIFNLIIIGLFSGNVFASKIEELDSPLGWNIELRPSVLFGSDGPSTGSGHHACHE